MARETVKRSLESQTLVMQKRISTVLKVISLLLLTIVVGLSISLGVFMHRQSATEEVCMSKGCIDAASKVISAMDATANPCEDFFQFSCGSWVKDHVIPESKSAYTAFDILDETVDIKLKALLEDHKSVDDPAAMNEAKDVYKACMDEEAMERIGLTPLYNVLSKLGGWPMISPAWNESQFDLMALVNELSLAAYQDLIAVGNAIDQRNNTNHILTMYELSLTLPSRNHYLDPYYTPAVEAYKQLIWNIGYLLNGTDMYQDVEEIVELETFIANISMTPTESRDPDRIYNKMKIEDLYRNISPKFDWLRYVNTRYNQVNYTFSNQSDIIVHSPYFYQKLIERVTEMPPRSIANYLIWRVVQSKILVLPEFVRDILFEYEKVVYGFKAKQPSWKYCLRFTSQYMGTVVGRLFVDKHFNETAKVQALKMISNVRGAFNDLLENVEWMDDKTRQVAKEKAEAIQNQVGYPNWILNDEELDKEFKREIGNLGSNTNFDNLLVLQKASMLRNLEAIDQPVNKRAFTFLPMTVNAFYSSSANAIKFPAGILQPPFWQLDRPESMNYGAIGTVIGHEITHGFDDRGRKYDKEGNLVEWWDETVVKAFDEAKQCIVDQYETFLIPEINRTVNGELTQGENIADAGGIKQSYKAFQDWYKYHPEGQRLPGLEYTADQLFFIAFSQIHCGSSRLSAIERAWESNEHSPRNFRVQGTLMNFPEFAKVFNCPKGSTMNPVNRCSVW